MPKKQKDTSSSSPKKSPKINPEEISTMREKFHALREDIKEWFKGFISKVPKQYNQAPLIRRLADEAIELYISITTRGDGKTTTYIHAFFELALDKGIRSAWFGRHFTIRNAYMRTIIEAIDIHPTLSSKHLIFKRFDDYIEVYYKDTLIMLLSDLEHATDLKYSSSILKKYQVLVYDEFLALERDYLPDEDELLKTVFDSMTRGDNKPKIVLLGNPVNFESPLLAQFDLFTILENHPINSVAQYGNILIETKFNEYQQEKRTSSLFKKYDAIDPMSKGQFKFNKYNLNNTITQSSHPYKVVIKYNKKFIEVYSDRNYKNVVVKVTAYSDYYDFCLSLSDLDGKAQMILPKHFKETFYKQYYNQIIKYFDAFSLGFIDHDTKLQSINLYKLLAIKYSKTTENKGLEHIVESSFERSIRILAKKYSL